VNILLCDSSERSANTLGQIREITTVEADSLSLVSKVVQCQCYSTEVGHSTPVSHHTVNTVEITDLMTNDNNDNYEECLLSGDACRRRCTTSSAWINIGNGKDSSSWIQ